ncbi:hypothetical protein C1H46_041684 [Malus baccata]|uniref:Uncharacterized protein n=1 Tax=Malus baccata TaxID=106549 RepID=A0A540KEV9_MALBA|nr:hypothetical protein C1H46_041681 [Malus baccata]TQD72765.1 hypothetical protein C1H46_041684 [Malus baccata]
MASNYTTIVAPSPLRPESITHRLAAANVNFNNGRAKTTSPNPIPMIGLITGLFSTGNPCADLFFNVIKPEKVSPASGGYVSEAAAACRRSPGPKIP